MVVAMRRIIWSNEKECGWREGVVLDKMVGESLWEVGFGLKPDSGEAPIPQGWPLVHPCGDLCGSFPLKRL